MLYGVGVSLKWNKCLFILATLVLHSSLIYVPKKCCISNAKVAKAFLSCSYRLCVLQCDWWLEISCQKAISFNEESAECDQILSWGVSMRLN